MIIPSKPFSRRKALPLLGAGAVALSATRLGSPFLATAGTRPSSSDDSDRMIVVRDSGGVFRTAWREAFYLPFERETGIRVVPVTSAAEPTAQILMMVKGGNYLWDMAGALTEQALTMLVEHEAVEPHGLQADACLSGIPAEYCTPYSIPSDIYTTVMAFERGSFPTGRIPRSWSEFWDRRGFPQLRSLRRDPTDTLEAALLADGVSPQTLYPLDLDRAFKSLERLRPSIAAWWTSAAQAHNLLQSGEVDMLASWSTRIDMNSPRFSVCWEQNIWGIDSWAILKGTPKADLCRAFIKFTCDAKRQAIWTKWLRNGPPNHDAYRYIPHETASILPTYPDHIARGVRTNARYWSAHRGPIIERFNEWLLQ